ncbi:hypothetical protein DICVIV_08435 [Dictyocaulus viviparus]|uniref:Uncharacterized protein n=1 Tax=Dictyocaulus viviparus TaxID=29172 RepID=A0A0D8XLK3_DICVI|nr:hypothetical protein DICVIV_08435 [Dictyocaulus viviparus]
MAPGTSPTVFNSHLRYIVEKLIADLHSLFILAAYDRDFSMGHMDFVSLSRLSIGKAKGSMSLKFLKRDQCYRGWLRTMSRQRKDDPECEIEMKDL